MNAELAALLYQKRAEFRDKHGRGTNRQEHLQMFREALRELALEPTVRLCAESGVPPHYFFGPRLTKNGRSEVELQNEG